MGKDNACVDCPSGYTCNGITATKCNALKYVKDNICVDCPNGHTCDGAAATKCDAPKYVKDNACTGCPSGHTCDGAAATKCNAPKYVKDNTCLECKKAVKEGCRLNSQCIETCPGLKLKQRHGSIEFGEGDISLVRESKGQMKIKAFSIEVDGKLLLNEKLYLNEME